MRKNQGQFLINLLEGELYVGSLNRWLVSGSRVSAPFGK